VGWNGSGGGGGPISSPRNRGRAGELSGVGWGGVGWGGVAWGGVWVGWGGVVWGWGSGGISSPRNWGRAGKLSGAKWGGVGWGWGRGRRPSTIYMLTCRDLRHPTAVQSAIKPTSHCNAPQCCGNRGSDAFLPMGQALGQSSPELGGKCVFIHTIWKSPLARG
jgi:hypothetical protein